MVLACAEAFGVAVVPAHAYSLNLSGAGPSEMKDSAGHPIETQTAGEMDFSYIRRVPIAGSDWYAGWGLRGQIFSFDNREAFAVRRLQDYGPTLSLEYFVGSDAVVALVVRPGFYFEEVPTLSSFDTPFQFVTGIPISQKVSGVVGVAHGLFYAHPLPIAGLVWTPTERVTLVAVYPEPSLMIRLNKEWEGSLSGELLGDGYRTDPQFGGKKMEYFDYRVGGNIAWHCRKEWRLLAGAGYEVQRVFNFFTDSSRIKSTGGPFVRLGAEFTP
jgi:hypothetical protein